MNESLSHTNSKSHEMSQLCPMSTKCYINIQSPELLVGTLPEPAVASELFGTI